MRPISFGAAVVAALAVGGTARTAAQPAATIAEAESWGPAPAVFPRGAQMAVLQGDPSKAEPFTVRLRFPDGYRIPPHTLPTDEHVTVIAGTLSVGTGDRFVGRDMQSLGVGAFVTEPAGRAHYAAASGVTVVQVHAVGPFELRYVNAADLPLAARGTH